MTFEVAVTAVQVATTFEAIVTVLMLCTKLAMMQVYETITGHTLQFKSSTKKEVLAKGIANRIQSWRVGEKFKNEHSELEQIHSHEEPKQAPIAIEQSRYIGIVRDENGKVRSVFDFSSCKEEKLLRKVLNATSVESLEYIARAYREFHAPDRKKRLTKKFLVDAIVKIYFPNHEPAPQRMH